jgi:hypothetical protein
VSNLIVAVVPNYLKSHGRVKDTANFVSSKWIFLLSSAFKIWLSCWCQDFIGVGLRKFYFFGMHKITALTIFDKI